MLGHGIPLLDCNRHRDQSRCLAEECWGRCGPFSPLFKKGIECLVLVFHCSIVTDVGTNLGVSATRNGYSPFCCQEASCTAVQAENPLGFHLGFDSVHPVGVGVEELHVLEELINVCRCSSWLMPHLPEVDMLPQASEPAFVGDAHSDLPLLPCYSFRFDGVLSL